jgi:hypothetical protein
MAVADVQLNGSAGEAAVAAEGGGNGQRRSRTTARL